MFPVLKEIVFQQRGKTDNNMYEMYNRLYMRCRNMEERISSLGIRNVTEETVFKTDRVFLILIIKRMSVH